MLYTCAYFADPSCSLEQAQIAKMDHVCRKVDLRPGEEWEIDFLDIRGQQHAKRALEVAAAGGHNLLMIGPPGSGKTMLARRLPTILPPLTFQEILDVTRIYSAAGLLPRQGVVGRRPFRSPHHTISPPGMVGGGLVPKPGEVSLAHHGVLFLDELPEFRKETLESLRQPLEDGEVSITRTSMSVIYPSSFMLVAAMNPCDDAFAGPGNMGYECTERQRFRYYSKLSRPFLDRIDIHVEVPKVVFGDMLGKPESERSESIRSRVVHARRLQLRRLRGTGVSCNARMRNREVKRFCPVSCRARELLQNAVDNLGFSARAFHRVLKVARTIADLAGEEEMSTGHVAEAVQYRILDKQF